MSWLAHQARFLVRSKARAGFGLAAIDIGLGGPQRLAAGRFTVETAALWRPAARAR